MHPLLWLAPALFALIDWRAVIRHDRRTEAWAKPATLLALLVVAALQGGTDTTAGLWLLVALGFGALGDIALLSDSLPRFRAGLGFFLIGHLAYVASFLNLGLAAPGWAWAVLAVLVGTVLATKDVVPATHRLAGITLSAPVATYTLVIGAMLVTAWFTGLGLVALGATIFVVSDATLSVDRFVRPRPWGHLAVMVTYHVGQALIVLGVLSAVG